MSPLMFYIYLGVLISFIIGLILYFVIVLYLERIKKEEIPYSPTPEEYSKRNKNGNV